MALIAFLLTLFFIAQLFNGMKQWIELEEGNLPGKAILTALAAGWMFYSLHDYVSQFDKFVFVVAGSLIITGLSVLIAWIICRFNH